MADRPIVLVHGYSAKGAGFGRWKEILLASGYSEDNIHIVTYKTLTNEITLKDIAEGFDRALRLQVGLTADEEFDAIVHSTGMLVLRAWLVKYSSRRERLRHLIGLAPATFGSPLAHKGRGWLGSLIKGNRERGPDFMEAGDLVLDGLELGSKFTWDLAHEDMIGKNTFYGETKTTPYVFTFCGISKYKGIQKLVSEDGSDGTVRLAGCALNTRKIILDLSTGIEKDKRVTTADWSNVDISLIPIADLDHGSIMDDPSQVLIDLLLEGLAVHSAATFKTYLEKTNAHSKTVLDTAKKAKGDKQLDAWQQLVFRVVDERGEPVPDYYIDFIYKPKDSETWLSISEEQKDFKMDIHVYKADPSFRCFHINLDSVDVSGATLGIRLLASSGTVLVGYHGYTEKLKAKVGDDMQLWDGVIDLSELNKEVRFFYPFTTTLIEIKLNREPLPLSGFNDLVFFPDAPERKALQSAQDLAEAMRQKDRDQKRLDELQKQFQEDIEKTKSS